MSALTLRMQLRETVLAVAGRASGKIATVISACGRMRFVVAGDRPRSHRI